jgi:ribonucleoside-triphosphate reductase
MKNVQITQAAKDVEEFCSTDKKNLRFWFAKLEKYSRNRVVSACMAAGTKPEVAERIAKEIDGYVDNRVKMSDVRPLIFALLQRYDQNAARRFKGSEIYVRTSQETFERFDRSKIVKSLIRETELDENIANQIAYEVEHFIHSSKVDYVSSPLVREITNVKLLEYGLEDARKLYTRVGMPVFDITKLINKGDKENANLQYNPETIHKLMADAISREYTLTKLLPLELADAHLNGRIHIHDLDYFFSRPFCFSHDVRFFLKNGFRPDGSGDHTSIAGPAKKPEVAFLHAAKVLAASQTNCAGGQGFSYFNTFMAPTVRGMTYKQMKQMAQMFIYEMSQMYVARGGQTVFSSIDLDMHIPKMFRDVPAIQLGGKVNGNTYADYEDEVKQLFNAFLDVFLEGDWKGKPFNFPKMEVQLDPADMKTGKYDQELLKLSELAGKFGTPYYIIHQPYMPDFSCYQCCAFLMPLDKSSDYSDMVNGTVRGGSLQVVTLNLPQLGYDSEGNENKIFERIDERMELIKRIMIQRRDLIEKNLQNNMLPFLNQKVDDKGSRYLEPNKQSYTIGIVGMNELVKFITGEELHDSQSSWTFGLKVMKYLKDKTAQLREKTGMNFALARTPAESCAQRLANIDIKRYPNKAVYQGEREKGSAYYTNSFHVRPNAGVPLFKRMSLEGSFHPLTDGGAMSHVWLGEANPNTEAIMELTKKIATKTALQYMSFTKDLTICDDCGNTAGGIQTECPKCKSTKIQVWSRITGYYQNIKGWNKAKLQELKDRQRYTEPEFNNQARSG